MGVSLTWFALSRTVPEHLPSFVAAPTPLAKLGSSTPAKALSNAPEVRGSADAGQGSTVAVPKELMKHFRVVPFDYDLRLTAEMITLLGITQEQTRDVEMILSSAREEVEKSDDENLVLYGDDQNGSVFMVHGQPSEKGLERKESFEQRIKSLLAPWQAETFLSQAEYPLHCALGDFGNETRVYRIATQSPTADSGGKSRYTLEIMTIADPSSLQGLSPSEIFSSEKVQATSRRADSFETLPDRYKHIISEH